jgi:hypothetical protein
MRRFFERRPSPATAIAIAALVVALGGAAFAAIPDGSGKIHGCYAKGNGNLRVVESSSDCRASERAIEWNQQGPPGSSHRIVARARSEGPVTSISIPELFIGGDDPGINIPLSGSEWAQQPLEIDKLYGEITYRKPFSGYCAGPDSEGPHTGNLVVSVGVDGTYDAAAISNQVTRPDSAPPADAPGTYTVEFNVDQPPLDGLDYLPFFESGPPKQHAIAAKAADNCTDGKHFVVESVKVDVVGFR